MWEILSDATKGRKIVATKNIPKNTVILKERPKIVAEDVYDVIYSVLEDPELYQDYTDLAPSRLDRRSVKYTEIQSDLETLPEHIRDSLSQMKPDTLRLLVTKFHRNAFNYRHYHSPPCAVLFQGALLNHSCDNNVDFYVDGQGAFVFKTNRDIQQGEELCDTYIPSNLSFKKRKKRLLEQYNFECECAKCRNKLD